MKVSAAGNTNVKERIVHRSKEHSAHDYRAHSGETNEKIPAKRADTVRIANGSAKLSSNWNLNSKRLLFAVTFVALILRMVRINFPSQVVFDEVHFGGFASLYLKGTYFFDVHPPFGKLLIAAIGYFNGYKGTFSFKDIGMPYSDDPTVPFVEMRSFMAICGTAAVSLLFASMIELGFTPLAAAVAGAFVALDNASVIQSRFILLDAMLLLFIFGSVFSWIKFRKERYHAFGPRWWGYLFLTGAMLAGTVGVKLVGLFTVALIGFACMYDLWELADSNRSMSNNLLWRHFFARFAGLAVFPTIIYLFFYYVHFKALPLTGPGDIHMSPNFQKTLLGNGINSNDRIVYYGQTVRIQSRLERTFLHSHDHRIPRTHLDGKMSSAGQQVNGYSNEDPNNEWHILYVPLDEKENPLDPEKIDKYGRRPIRAGDHVQICHKLTNKCILTHDVASPLTRTDMEVTMYEENDPINGAIGQSIWVIQPIGENESDSVEGIRCLSSSFLFVHKMMNVRLTNYAKNLPPWGFSQREIHGSRKTEDDVHQHWFISDILDAPTSEEAKERGEKERLIKPMSFFAKFWELQTYSMQVNGKLQDDHPFKSRPEEWILPRKGLGFWIQGLSGRIMLLGNFVAWTLAALGLFVFSIRFPKDRFLEHRGCAKSEGEFYQKYPRRILFIFGAWALHYLPFFLMGRSLYLHHYLPAYMFSCMLLGGQFDYYTLHWRPLARRGLALSLVLACAFAFYWLYPLVYGTELSEKEWEKLKLIKAWNF